MCKGQHAPAGFLKLLFSMKLVCMHVYVCVSTPEAINNQYCDDWLNKFCNVYMAGIISIASRRGLKIKTHRNQPNKSKLSLCKLLLSL